MIKEIRIKTIGQIMEIISDQNKNNETGRYRSLSIYRGLSNVDFNLVTSLKRNCKDKTEILEGAILKNFTKYAVIDDPAIQSSVWRQLILGQHHGLPTRLLDWTHSPLIALHFAVSEGNYDDMEAHDCVVWKMDMEELKSLLPKKYIDELINNNSSVINVAQLDRLASSLKEYDEDMSDKSFVVMEPPSIDPRIVNQYSFFAVVPSKVENIEDFLDKNTNNTVKYVIDKNLRWRIRDMLDQLNISERIVYPGLDGLSKWLGRHYYVK